MDLINTGFVGAGLAGLAAESLRLPFVEVKPSESRETKTKVFFKDGEIYAESFRDGVKICDNMIIEDIVDVRKFPENGIPKVVIVDFADGTSEKAILDEKDISTYSLEQGISTCIAKKMFSKFSPYGSSLYNKVLKRALNVMEEKERTVEAVKKEIAESENRLRKQAEKRKKRKEKLDAMERERKIEIQKEAYIRAYNVIQEMNKARISENAKEISDLLISAFDELEKGLQGNSDSDTKNVEDSKTE